MWVFLGGAVGAAVAIGLLRYRPGRFTMLSLSVVTSLLLGAFYATVRHSQGLGAFVGFGVLATAASFILVAEECSEVPTTVAKGFQTLRKVTVLIVMQAALCVTFAAVGFLSVHSALVIYQKLMT